MSIVTDGVEHEALIAVELRKLRTVTGVTGALVASVDGRAISHDLVQHSPGAAAAVVASTLALGERLGELTGAQGLQELQVRTTQGYAVLSAVNHQLVLAVLTNLTVNLARLKLELRDAVRALGRIGH